MQGTLRPSARILWLGALTALLLLPAQSLLAYYGHHGYYSHSGYYGYPYYYDDYGRAERDARRELAATGLGALDLSVRPKRAVV